MSQIKMIPYPMLGKRGYKNSTYSGKVCSISLTDEDYILKIEHEIANEELEEKILNGEFCCVTSITNSSFYKHSEIHDGCKKVYEIIVPRSSIRGRFEIEIFFRICAKINVMDYSNSDFDEVFSGYSFNFNKGDMVGEAEKITIQLDAGYEQLEQSSSFLRFRAHLDEKEQSILFKTHQDHVTFYLPKDMHEEYKKAKANGSKALLGILVTPALMELLHYIRNNPETFQDYEKYSWIETLEERCGDELEIFNPDHDVFKLVTKILESPTLKSISQLNALLTQIDEYE